jgi:hypothetical protein
LAKPWHRYEQNFINHPKFLVLSPGAICLWLEGKNYCDMHLTDGLIPRDALRTFRFQNRGRIDELLQTIDGYSGSLWESHPVGFKMHDYLNHNPCRDDVMARMDRADEERERKKSNQKAWRDRHRNQNVTGNADGNVTGDVTGHARDNETGTLPDKQKQIQKQNQKEQEQERSPRPIFTGQRLTVHEWMLNKCLGILGEQADGFDLHSWFFDLDATAVKTGQVIPARGGWPWLQAQLVAEARRRGLNLAMASAAPAGKPERQSTIPDAGETRRYLDTLRGPAA